jgi:hypothetical protein
MSEQINKILASTAQAFTTAEQAQARANINAQKTIAYSYDGTRITAIDNSAVGLNAVSANNCISGDGSSGSPLGLSATAQWTGGANWYPMTEISAGYLKISAQAIASAQIYQDESSLCNWTPTGITVRHTASGVGGGHIANYYGETINLNYNAGQYYLRHISSDASGLRATQKGNPSNVSIFGFGSAAFSDDNGSTWEVVNPSAIRVWNSLKPETRWESSFQATSDTYPLLNIPKNATALINLQGRFDHCSYVNMTTADGGWLSVSGDTTAGGGFTAWPLTNITTVAKGGTAESGYTPRLQVVTTGDTTVGFTANMVIKEV